MTMVVQHLENRLALSSVHPNEQLHEFQIVHALITQCRKQASYEDADNNCNGYQCPSPSRDMKDKGTDKNDKASFVNTIRQTFNALAQATNPSLCAKQNIAHPVSIASTVKNIISQFSRQACHGSIYSSSPCKETDLKSDTSQGKVIKQSNSSRPTQINRRNYKRIENEAVLEPSTSQDPVVERTEIKSATVVRQKTNMIPPTTKPKTRLERTRNSSGLVRHESAPPVLDQGKLRTAKKTTSVKRSKSDAVCYQTHSKRNRRKIDSNVQTKVLHFEKCCEEPMCVECRRSSEEELIQSKPISSLVIASRADTIIPKQESFMGALSYHKPSIISQNATSSAVAKESSNETDTPEPTDITISAPQTTVKPKAVMCPGGTYFPCNGCTSDKNFSKRNMTPEENATITSKDERLDIEIQENSSSYAKTMESEFHKQSTDPCVSSRRMLEDVDQLPQRDGDAIKTDTLLKKIDSDMIKSSSTDSNQLACNNPNLYTRLCSIERVDSLDAADLVIDSDSSDNADSSSSSSNELSSPSPRQDYIDRHNGILPPVRRAPSARYKRIRRKLKKLITRSRSCSEPVQQEVFLTQAEREQEFLLSLRIPTPTFMLPEGNASFDVKRQQLAMHFEKNKDYMKRLPDHVLTQIFSHLDTRSLAMLKCVCADFNFLINSYDIRGIDSLWVEDVRYMEDPCRFCRKKFTPGDVSMCRYHAKYYHCDLPYGRSYWMCCFQLEKNSPGCKIGIHDNRWALFQDTSNL